ncbi:DUF5786 family protein [Halovivax limisalsi]|uniref:DUF5786 family protein n=1 Tax=Halovivax limisalsi TaxID=1453760 RepID=UPI001FFC4DEA|nr:DUF5786 family protein [Halovivax limisalsi]
MGWGRYDESLHQEDVGDESDADDIVDVHENDHAGTVSDETESSTDELLGQLQRIKETGESE